MIGLQISARDRRAIVVGLGVMLALVGGTRLVPSWLSWTRSTRAQSLDRAVALRRARAIVGQSRATRDSMRARTERLAQLSRALVDGETPATAAGALASLVADAATAARVRLDAAQVRADSAVPSAAFVPISVRADVVGDVAGLSRLLSALEGGRTLLAVRVLSISNPEPAASPEHAENLRVTLIVEGLALNPARRAMP
ncbi:MAG: type II secretion system protein GspM [Gemmatimonadaceae bacterium]